MIYFLFIVGVILCVYGWQSMKKQNQKHLHKESFHQAIVDQEDNHGEYIKLLSLYQELKNSLEDMQAQLNTISEQTSPELLLNILEKDSEEIDKKEGDSLDYAQAADKIEKMSKNNKSIEEMALELNMGKGEVLLLKRLLTK